jgi:hypothetical protein
MCAANVVLCEIVIRPPSINIIHCVHVACLGACTAPVNVLGNSPAPTLYSNATLPTRISIRNTVDPRRSVNGLECLRQFTQSKIDDERRDVRANVFPQTSLPSPLCALPSFFSNTTFADETFLSRSEGLNAFTVPCTVGGYCLAGFFGGVTCFARGWRGQS